MHCTLRSYAADLSYNIPCIILHNFLILINMLYFVTCYSTCNCTDQVMPMNTNNSCLQDGQDIKTAAPKRKAEDYFINVDNVSSSKDLMERDKLLIEPAAHFLHLTNEKYLLTCKFLEASFAEFAK